jgi:flavin reductase (DIM6/NTAB) family NADH-FMN oxidoreductase RutF
MRVPVPLDKAWRLFNHGPVTLVSSAHDGDENVMAAAWVMPLDFSPPKLAAVLAADTHTRTLVERSATLVIQVPPRAMLSAVESVGSSSGRDTNKWERFGLERDRVPETHVPLVRGCVAWLAARVVPEPALAERYDLFVCEGFAAWADDRVYRDARLRDDGPEELRSLHHVAGGAYVVDGPLLRAR